MMTGKWRTSPPDSPALTLDYYTSNTTDTESVYFTDQRGFAQLAVISPTKLREILASLGPDILSPASKFSFSTFKTQLQKVSRTMLVSAIAKQDIISGVGNYLRSDILYTAKLDPRRSVSSLTDAEWKTLYKTVRKVSEDSYKAGSTAKYTGVSSGYVPVIYQHTEDKHGNEVCKFKNGSQTVFWVPDIQK